MTSPEMTAPPDEPIEIKTPKPFQVSSCTPGTILAPGDYLVEIASKQLMGDTPQSAYDNVIVALAMMGWDEVLLDQSMPGHAPLESVKKSSKETGPKATDLWTTCEEDEEIVSRFRFMGRLEEPIQIQEHSAIRWLYLQGLAFDPFREWRYKTYPFELKKDGLYELLFFSRIGEASRKGALENKSKRDVLVEELTTTNMRWGDVKKITALKKNIRLPGYPNASITTWYGVARWKGENAYITDEDPLFFEDVMLVQG